MAMVTTTIAMVRVIKLNNVLLEPKNYNEMAMLACLKINKSIKEMSSIL